VCVCVCVCVSVTRLQSQSCTFVFWDLEMSLAVFVFGFLGKPVCERLSLGNGALLAGDRACTHTDTHTHTHLDLYPCPDGGQRGSSWCDVSLRTAGVEQRGSWAADVLLRRSHRDLRPGEAAAVH